MRLKPVITGQPVAQTVTEGDSVFFTVAVNGTAPFTYQWRENESNISAATNSTLKIKAAAIKNGCKYQCIVMNAAGSVSSNEVILTVNLLAPTITSNPQSSTIFLGSSVTLAVAATGTNITYQWQKGGINILGETATSLTFSATKLSNNGTFRCKVSNSGGDKFSNDAILTVRPRGMRLIPGGTFTMGEYGKDFVEPVHQVTITKEFWMDTTEVTQPDYQNIMNITLQTISEQTSLLSMNRTIQRYRTFTSGRVFYSWYNVCSTTRNMCP